MKIGILTFHRAHNYGAMLQAYALYCVLSKKGHEVEFISYRNLKIESAYKFWRWKYNKNNSIILNFKTLFFNIITLYRWQSRRCAFLSFARKFLPESDKLILADMQDKTFNYDIIFFGSDQIWTTRFLGRFDPIYWGEVQLKHGVKIAYAPSMELSLINEAQRNFIREHLALFDAVSARETSMGNLLTEISNKKIQIVLDPTFLCREKDYLPLLREVKFKPDSKYILVYQVGDFDVVHEMATYLSNIIKCPILEIRSNVAFHKRKGYKETLGPADFINLIANATFVLSCSFHGTAFAINYHKPFYSVLIEGSDSRTISLLEQTGLKKRGIRSIDNIDNNDLFNIDFNYAEEKLTILRKQSMDYINRSLSLKQPI